MKQLLALQFVLLSVIAVQAQEKEPWVRLVSEPGRFSVLFPDAPREKSETRTTSSGRYTTHLYIVKKDRGLFMVGWVDYDSGFRFGEMSGLQTNRDNFIAAVKATLLHTTRISLNGNPGLEFTAVSPELVFKSRIYMVGRRPYQLISGTYKARTDSYDISRFFDSFQLGPAK